MALADAAKKPLPSDWQQATCLLYIFKDPGASSKNMIKKTLVIDRHDCVNPDRNSFCDLQFREEGSVQKALQLSMTDTFGNTATYSFGAMKDDMHSYDVNFAIRMSMTDKAGKNTAQINFQRFGTVRLPVGAQGEISRFTIECDPDVDYGYGGI